MSSLQEASRFFMGEGQVWETLRRLSARLREEDLDHAIAGGLAVFQHGYRRTTADIGVLMTSDALAHFHERLVGRGYVPAFDGARRSFRDAETGGRIDVLVRGEFPGDGLRKAVSFPDPAVVVVDIDGIPFVRLEALLELKLASGLSAPHRLQDLADVQQLIVARALPRSLAERLDPSVRAEYVRLWSAAEEGRKER